VLYGKIAYGFYLAGSMSFVSIYLAMVRMLGLMQQVLMIMFSRWQASLIDQRFGWDGHWVVWQCYDWPDFIPKQ
jgi:hypothetical protein